MPLATGASVGPYQILALLGSGGMGEVYRARDTRLNRQVAIKVLSAPSANAERRVRLEREARVLSQLTHPHICTLHDVGEHDGATYLVLELLDGETLADRLERSKSRPLPLKEALGIAVDVAGALDAAHRHGIVHRDMKPSNVMLTKAGAKLLDFGIAKDTHVLLESGTPAAEAGGRNLDTVTAEGALLGTLQYAAPEQLEGRAADTRSDIFSFGAMLYEMLTGRRAFDGESQSKVIAAVLDHDPPPVGSLQPNTPPALARIVQKCLAKDPDRRWQSAGDLADELRWVGDQGPENATSSAAQSTVWHRPIPLAAGVVLVAALTSAVWWSTRPEAPSRAVSRFTIPLGEGQRFPPPAFRLISISPDGTQLVYSADNRLYLRSMSDFEARPIPGSEEQSNALNPVFSPDGRWIVFYSDVTRTLRKIAVTGGATVTLCAAGHPDGISWGAAGILFGSQPGWGGPGIVRISPDGGKPDVVIAVKGDEHASSPQLLPDNETVLFTLLKGEAFDRWDKAQIVAQSLKSGQRTTLIDGGSDGRYLPSGHLVYSRGRVLYGIPFDVRQLRTTGGPVPIVDGVHRSGATGTASWGLADNGTLVYVQGPAPSTDHWGLAISDRQGVVEPLKVAPGAYLAPRISPDGNWVAVTVDDEREANIWLYDRKGTAPGRRLTYEGRNRFAEWSPDGQRLAFQSDREGDQGLFWQLVDGTGRTERLTKAEPGAVHIPESWSSDGEHLLFGVIASSKRSVMTFSFKDKKTELLFDDAWFSTFSPDGRWVAYTHYEGTSSPLIVQPFPATGAKYQVWAYGVHTRWSRDGKELFATTGPPYRGEAVTVTTQPTIAFSRPVPTLFGRRQVGVGPLIRNFDILPDDEHFLMLVQPGGSDVVPQIEVVLNWTDELKQRLAER